jgi:predicted lactoylglutathione lyase
MIEALSKSEQALCTGLRSERKAHMAYELYMIGLIVHDMQRSLEFYRRLGLAIPDGAEGRTHVQIKMKSGLTLFLDSRPSAWENGVGNKGNPEPVEVAPGQRVILEFYLDSQAEVDAKYQEMIDFDYQSYREPFEAPFNMHFAMINDPDGNTVLLSADKTS